MRTDDTAASRLKTFLAPTSIGIVGASDTAGGYPARIFENLMKFGYAGDVYPVNPRRTEVFGMPCHPSLSALEQPPQLALIMTPAKAVSAVIEDAAQAGVPAAVVFASGFAETGEGGLAVQRHIQQVADEAGMTILGPNSQGFFYQPNGVVASFSTVLEHGLRADSSVAYVGQSGALGGSVLGLADARGIGIGAWFSTGNEIGLTGTAVAAELLHRDDIHIVAIHLEAVPDGRTWQELAEAVYDTGKRVVCLRSGRSAASQRAAASHTGAMVRDDAAFDLLAEEAGIRIVDDIDTVLDVVEAWLTPRPTRSRRMAIITTSGGAGGLVADHLDRYGIEVPELSAQTRAALAEVVPAYGAVTNPVDVTAQLFATDVAAFGTVCRITAEDESVDGLVIAITNLTGDTARTVAEAITKNLAASKIPCLVIWLAPPERIAEATSHLVASNIRVFQSFRELARSADIRLQPDMAPTDTIRAGAADLGDDIDAALGDRCVLTEHSGGVVLQLANIDSPKGVIVVDGQDPAHAAAGLTPPFVVKIQSPDILHKTDVGGVRLEVTPDDLADAVAAVRLAAGQVAPTAAIDGVLVQETAPGGIDLIVGVRGPQNGYPATLTVGAGGITAELNRDIATALIPVNDKQVGEVLRRLRIWPLLNGYRSTEHVDVASLTSALSRLSAVADALGPRLLEMEINPLRVCARGVIALDLLIRFTSAVSVTNSILYQRKTHDH